MLVRRMDHHQSMVCEERWGPRTRCMGRFVGIATTASALLGRTQRSYLVDPKSTHILLLKTKPCMCKYKLFSTVKLRMAH